MKNILPIAFIALFVCCNKVSNAPLAEEDSELVTLLNELDECEQTNDREKRFHLYSQVSTEYEKKNLIGLWQHIAHIPFPSAVHTIVKALVAQPD